jgi:phosphatidylglycerophosphate synthase
MLETLPTNAGRRGSRGGVLLDHLAMLAVVVALALGLQHALALTGQFAFNVIALFSAGGALTLVLAIRHDTASDFGAANRVTLLRGGLVAVLFGLIGEVGTAWAVVAIAGTVLALDGVDGWLARRLRIVTAFGARFDMETDALLLVALTGLAWQYGKAGPWILLAGVMRYGFVAAAKFMPQLARPLPPSQRRKAAFVVQAITLIICLAPVVVPPLSNAIALAGLVLLTASFAIDVVYLTREGGKPETPAQA